MMRGKSVFRSFLLRRSFHFRSLSSSSSSSSFRLNQNYLISTPKTDSSLVGKPYLASIQESLNHHPSRFSNFPRSFCSSEASSAPPNVVPIKSQQEFDAAFSKTQNESKSAVFYFTAVWCGPCRTIAPIVEKLARQYPHVTTYKVDIDEESLASTLMKLQISSVPTFHFFKEGKKSSEMIGADLTGMVQRMKELYEK